MIPRFKPALGMLELAAMLRPCGRAKVEAFERAFAAALGQGHAVSFAYGRSALWAMLKALELDGAEVVMPAYTCVTVAHAVVHSGNTPVFVDIAPDGFNMDLDLLAESLRPQTRMVIPTHLFGFPMDVDRVGQQIADAERRFGHKIWVLQDCAHSYDAHWQGKPVCRAGDAALFASNIAKYMTSIAGGTITTDEVALAAGLREGRQKWFHAAGGMTGLSKRLYGIATMAAFSRPLFGLTWWLEHRTRLLDGLSKYYDEDAIDMPGDFRRRMTPVEAAVGCTQIGRLRALEARRRVIARRYCEALGDVRHLDVDPFVEGATYSHFPAWLDRQIDRAAYQETMARRGVDIGHVVEYCIPSMGAYRRRFPGFSCPRAEQASRRVINLPMSPALSERTVDRVIAAVRAMDATLPRHRRPVTQRRGATAAASTRT